MQIQNLITQKYKRFFAFGCSFTHYLWPTWADVIGHDIPHYENWGMAGAGNQFIFNSIIECNRRNKFNEDDLVMVMWTSCSREDRYVDNSWLVAATENRKTLYGKDWMKKFGNQGKGLMIRDFATIDATQQLLDAFDCDWVNFNGPPLIRFDIDRAETDIKHGKATLDDLEQRWVTQQSMLSQNKVHWDEYLADREVIELYKDMFANIKEPLLHRVLKNKQRPNFGDNHPTPSESFDYVNDVLPNNLQVTEFVEYWQLQVNEIKTKNKMPVEFVRNIIQRF